MTRASNRTEADHLAPLAPIAPHQRSSAGALGHEDSKKVLRSGRFPTHSDTPAKPRKIVVDEGGPSG